MAPRIHPARGRRRSVAAAAFVASAVFGSAAQAASLPTFVAARDVPVGAGPFSVAVADFNRDGKADFATAGFNAAAVSIRLGDGRGGFDAAPDVPAPGLPSSVTVGD